MVRFDARPKANASSRLRSAACALVVALVSGPAFAATTWKVFELGTLGGETSYAAAVNNEGVVVGCAATADGVERAIVYSKGVMERLDLGALESERSCATAINDAGVVAGSTAASIVIRKDNAIINLGVQGSVADINAGGAIAGTFKAGGKSRAFVYRDGVLTEIGTLEEADPNAASQARGINDRGQVVGSINSHGFVYEGGALRFLLPPYSTRSSPRGINNHGDVVGLTASQYGQPSGFIERNGAIDMIVGSYCTVDAINDLGHVISWCEGMRGRVHWRHGKVGFAFANTQAVQTLNGLHRFELVGLNDRGWVVGHAVNAAERIRGILAVPMTAHDLDSDTRADLLWREPAGSHELWSMEGLSPRARATLPAGPTEIRHMEADFNGDAAVDILWRSPDGSYRIELRDRGRTIVSRTLLGSGTGWEVAGHGDFDGDGKDDLLWKHSGGAHGLWLMDGASPAWAGALAAPAPGFSIALVGDFDGDRKSDVLWRHGDGRVHVFLMNGSTARASAQLLAAGTGWAPVLAASLDWDDAKSDLLWKHDNGAYGIWFMDGTRYAMTASVLPAGSGWHLAAAARLNGDVITDLVWAHPDGRHAAWLMGSRETRFGSAYILGAGTGWQVVAARDLNGDGADDLLWRHTNGAYGGWLMDGLSAIATAPLRDAGSGAELVR